MSRTQKDEAKRADVRKVRAPKSYWPQRWNELLEKNVGLAERIKDHHVEHWNGESIRYSQKLGHAASELLGNTYGHADSTWFNALHKAWREQRTAQRKAEVARLNEVRRQMKKPLLTPDEEQKA